MKKTSYEEAKRWLIQAQDEFNDAELLRKLGRIDFFTDLLFLLKADFAFHYQTITIDKEVKMKCCTNIYF